MILDTKTDKFKECVCGNTPTSYSIGYGRTPYGFICKCGKQLHDAKCEITGNVNNMFSYWNNKIRHQTLNELKLDKKEFVLERERVERDNMERAKEYQYYWVAGEGEILAESW